MSTQQEQPEQQNPMSEEWITACLGRLRKKLTVDQDTMDCTSFAIKALEKDLEELKTKDRLANEENAKEE